MTSNVSRLAEPGRGAPGHRRLADPDRLRRGGGVAARASRRRSTCRSTRATPGSTACSPRTSATSPACRRSSTASSDSWSSSRRSGRSPDPTRFGRSYISGGLTLAVLVLPIIILVTMEALRAVPKSIREAAYGVGATRWEVVRSHVLPYAAPGIFTGAILSLARAFGETAPLLLVGAVTGYLSTPSAAIAARDPAGQVHGAARRRSSRGRGWPATTGRPTRPRRSSCCW